MSYLQRLGGMRRLIICTGMLLGLALCIPAMAAVWEDPWVGHVAPTTPQAKWFTAYPTIRPRTYSGDHLQYVRMPIGGIGTGTIWLNGQGILDTWQITNNTDERRLPDSFFAIRAQVGAKAPAMRILQTVPDFGLQPFTSLQFEGGYPIARLQFEDKTFPVHVRLEGFNPMIPTDEADSALPCAIFRVVVTNPNTVPVRVQALGSVQNLIRSSLPNSAGTMFGGNTNTLVREKGLTALAMTRKMPMALEGLLDVRDRKNLRVDGPPLLFAAKLTGGDETGTNTLFLQNVLESMGAVSRNGGGILVNEITPQFFATLRNAKAHTDAINRQLVVFEDFEKPNYDGWTVTGTAFGAAPHYGTSKGQQMVSGFLGNGLVNTYFPNDSTKGELLSRFFTINKRYIGMLVGGGNKDTERVNLLIDGKVALSCTGTDRELLAPVTWDVTAYQGKQAQIQIMDNDTGGWGHINVDQIVFADTDPASLLTMDPFSAACARLPYDAVTAQAATQVKARVQPLDTELKGLDPWEIEQYTRVALADFPEFRALATTSNGDPIVIVGDFGKAKMIISFAAHMPLSWTYRLLEIARGSKLPEGGRFVSTNATAGTLALSSPDAGVTAGSWTNREIFLAEFAKTGAIADPNAPEISPAGQTLNGAMAIDLTIPPGQERTASFVISWHFPNVEHYGHPGIFYARRFPDALAVARYIDANYQALYQRTRLYHTTMYQSNLPEEWLDAMTSQSVILRSPTCLWTEEGYFAGFEGAYGCCPLDCTHVWGYAQTQARLFPRIGRIMRQSDFLVFIRPSGEISHRQHQDTGAFMDGQLACILGAYREYQLSSDKAFLTSIWPNLKKSVDWIIQRLDADHNGTTAGRQPNTYDCDVSGSNTFIGSMYLAALAAAERMAVIMKEPETAQRWQAIRLAGMATQDADLWNGEYYIQKPDTRANDYGIGCHDDQLLGQWWAKQVGLGNLYPDAHVKTALHSIMKYNFRESFADFQQKPRRYVLDTDKGLLICTWPKGGRPDPFTIYSDEVWTGIEYAVAGAMIQEGQIENARKIVKAARDRYDGIRRDELNSGPGGNPFNELECGKFYARAMSSWGLLIASQGLVLDGPAGVLGFKPTWQPENHRSFFTAPEGWGLFIQTRTGKTQTERIEARHGRLRLTELVFALPEGAKVPSATVQVGGKAVKANVQMTGTEVRLHLSKECLVPEGSAVAVKLKW